jgi:ABC-2 type transport system ATP-binding protein
MKILEALSVSKKYGNLKAVDDLSLEVSQGEIYGFLGLNGAGKTTTIRMFLDMITPSSGIVKLFGSKVKSGDALLNKVGYLVETPSAYPELTVLENIQIYYRYRRLNDPQLIESAIEKLKLAPYRNVKSKNLSLGNKQRLGLAKVLFHRPQLLILDEPTNGLDPAGTAEFRNMLKELSRQGVTIFISSHLLDEVSRIATRIGIVHSGKLLREIPAAHLNSELNKTLMIISKDVERCVQTLASLGHAVSVDGDMAIRAPERKAVDNREQILKKLIEAEVNVSEFYVDTENLESYFLRQISTDEN